MNAQTIILTDPPELVKLKLEFGSLTMQEESLKERLQNIRNRKFYIAEAVLHYNLTPETPHLKPL